MSAKPVRVAINFDKGEVPFKKYGEIKDVKCDMICVSPIGGYKEPKPEDVEEQIQFLYDWTSNVGFPETYCSLKYEKIAKTGGALSLYLAPNIPARSDKIRAFGKYAMWLLLMDDIMDERTREKPPSTTYEALSADAKVLVSILNGERNGKTDAPSPVSTMSHFHVLCGVVQEIHDAFSSSLKSFGDKQNRKHLIKGTNDFLHGFLWRFGRPDPDNTSASVYLFFRRHHSASFCIFEIVALLNEIDWKGSKIDRHSVEFHCWTTCYSNGLSMSNDILSLRKEMGDNETENLAIHRFLNSDSDINEAITQCLQFTNGEAHEARIYGERLRSRNPESKQMAELVEYTHWSLDGHLYWYGFSQRYGQMKLKERHLTEAEYNGILNDYKKKKSALVKVY